MFDLKGKKIFVTGGTGFLGSHLLETLVSSGAEVTALYRTEKKLKAFKQQDDSLANLEINWLKGDLFSDWSLEGFDFVYHLAGYVGYTAEERKIMEEVNVEGTRRVLDTIQKTNPEIRLIYASSVVAVGAGLNDKQVLNEDSDFNVSKYNFGYFETKRRAETLVMDAVKTGLSAVIFNPSTIYGPRDMLKGSRKFQLKMAQGKLQICSRGGVSVVHVADVCEALLALSHKGAIGERYILSGDNISIHQLLSEIANQVGVSKPKWVIPTWLLISVAYIAEALAFLGIRLGIKLENLQVATMYHWFDSTKAKKDLDFKPRSYKEALRDSLDWAKQRGMF